MLAVREDKGKLNPQKSILCRAYPVSSYNRVSLQL